MKIEYINWLRAQCICKIVNITLLKMMLNDQSVSVKHKLRARDLLLEYYYCLDNLHSAIKLAIKGI